LAEAYRDKVRAVLRRPALRVQGPAESFACQLPFYYWLLDHPQEAVRLWQGLGVPCAAIELRGPDGFGWRDGQGSDLTWHTVARTPAQRVWYAEGQVKPGQLLPSAAVRAVVCLHHVEGRGPEGRPAIRHHVELFVQTDNRALALAARVLGASAPRLAEQYVAQVQTFFGALAWYLDEHPEQARALLAGQQSPPASGGGR
jgi:hypothetical protein